jgi:hypothetical protein
MNKLFGFIFISLILFSCNEETQINEIKGLIYSDCNNTPLKYAEIALRSNVSNGFSDRKIIGAGISDVNGKFQFTYELDEEATGNADLILVTPDGYIDLLGSLTANLDHNLTLYYPNQAEIQVNLSGTKVYSISDTLFIGVSSGIEELYLIQPTLGGIGTLHSSISNQYNTTKLETFYYGIGSYNFGLSKEALNIQDSSFNHINLNLIGCSQNELVDLVIN